MDKEYGTREWASTNVNFITGCSNNCLYCYARAMAIKFGKKTTDNWQIEEVRYKDLNKDRKKVKGRIMFPSSHDITPINLSSSIKLLQKLLEAGNEILIVSKPHLSCIKEICSTCKDYKSQVLFRFTIGSADNKTLKIWEPTAPSFEERLECLKYSYEQGYQTSVSCEPMLDNQISAVIEAVIPYVTDAVWIGTINNLIRHLIISGIDSPEVLAQAEILLAGQNVEEIKRLYNKYKDVDKIKWKSSIKKNIGIPLSDSIGADN